MFQRFLAQATGAASTSPVSMITRVPKENLYISKPTWWLESRFHFSFAEAFNYKQRFGVLRVLNDDLVKGKAGFGRHPHRDMEIFSYVVDGKLSHADSLGNKEALPRGAVQYLSAGTGITHEEMNDEGETCRFLQTWIMPDRRGHVPNYGSQQFGPESRHNKLQLLLSGTGKIPTWENTNLASDIKLHQDTNVFVSENDANIEHSISLGADRQAYLVVIEGELKVNDTQLGMRDAVEIVPDGTEDALPLRLASGPAGSHWMLVEMKKG